MRAPPPAGNIKATSPIAFTTSVLVWALMTFGDGFKAAKQTDHALASVRWGADYLMKVHREFPEKNSSMLVTRVRQGTAPPAQRGGV